MADETPTTPIETPVVETPTVSTDPTVLTTPETLETPAPETPVEPKPEDVKPEDAKPEPRAPAEYAEFALPEGLTVTEEQGTAFKEFAKSNDLTQDQAQKVLEYAAPILREQALAGQKVWTELQSTWQAEVKADPEIGGTKFADSVKTAAAVFVPSESNPFVKNEAEAKTLRDALNATGAGNNPAIVRMFVRTGQLLAEPGHLSGKPAAIDKKDAVLKSMYPTMEDV